MSRANTMGTFTVRTVTIGVSTTLSDAVFVGGHKLAAIEMSTGWTTANITFAVASSSSRTFLPLYDDAGAEVTVTSPAASRVVAVDVGAGSLAAMQWVKLRSGTVGSEVTQSTAVARTLYLWLKS